MRRIASTRRVWTTGEPSELERSLSHTMSAPSAAAAPFKHNILDVEASDTCNEKAMFVDVWADNLHEELNKIMDIVDDYPYIAMVRAPLFLIVVPRQFCSSEEKKPCASATIPSPANHQRPSSTY